MERDKVYISPAAPTLTRVNPPNSRSLAHASSPPPAVARCRQDEADPTADECKRECARA